MSLPQFQLHKTRVGMDDGRTLNYYDFAPFGEAPPFLEIHQNAALQNPPGSHRILEKPSEMRWNPTRGEWTVYAAHRMNRVQLPAKNACPICPGILELPLPYQIAIFENRSPAMSYVPGDLPNVSPALTTLEHTLPARGRCDMVVYSQNHDGKFPLLSPGEIYALVEAWRDRYSELMSEPEIQFTSIFENKGREAGMTLDHPHGQIYAFSTLPPDLQKQWDQTRIFADAGRDLWAEILEKELKNNSRIIAETDGFLAFVPFYARYPYEIHIMAKRDGVHDLVSMTPQERRELAGVMKNITLRYENLWGEKATYGFPTLMLMQQLTKQLGAEKYRFHIEYFPLQRSPEKLKYRASIETGAGTFLNDALPETQAAELQTVASRDVELPPLIFS